ncbi:MAG: NACHT and WD repeat domain-containing protein [Methylococcales bacterium]
MSASPYPGLRPFHRDEADIFFGRDEQVDQLLSKLGRSRFLAVVGPSGCGKSSLIYTGLLNALEAGFLAGVGLHWRIAALRPGAHPMRNLAEALVEQGGLCTAINPSLGVDPNPTDSSIDLSRGDQNPGALHDRTALLLATLRRGPLGLIETLREQPLAKDTNLLIVVDQFEEIFRYRQHQDRDEADALIALLLRSVIESDFPIYVVITMRSDFLGDCALFPSLPEALNDSQFLTPRLTREQRSLAITGPARVFGGEVEPALVNRLLNDMGADPDQLPVLQHALMRLWTVCAERGANPIRLGLHDYEPLGGWENTLSNHADQAYGEFTTTQQTIAEILFRSLSERSGPKRDTRRPVSLQTVAEVAGVKPDEVIAVVEAFRRSDRSFLMPPEEQPLTPETLIDISHESLIRQWQRMKEWVEREAQSAEIYRRLEQTALLYSEKRAGLLQGLDLFPVIEWKKREKPGPAWASRYGREFDRVMSFLASSELRHKLKSIGKNLALVVIYVIAISMAWLWQQAKIQRDKASSARLLAQAQLVRSQTASQYPLSALLAIEAVKYYPHPDFIPNQFLLDSLRMLPKPLHALQHDGPIYLIVYSPDGKRLATASTNNTARLWDAATGKELQRLKHEGTVTSVTFSPDGKWLTTASLDNTARLLDVATGQELQRLSHESVVTSVTFSPDGARLATASDDHTARLWLWQPKDLIDQLCERMIHNLSWDQWQKYLENEPYRKTCPDLPVDPDFREPFKRLLDQGKKAEAAEMLEQLNAADPTLQLNLGKEQQKWAPSKRLAEAEKLLKDRKIAEALAAFDEVQQLDTTIITADQWHNLCWDGAVMNFAQQVLPACEKAVADTKSDDLWMVRDSRGLARALTGNTQGAIEDFEYLIEKTDNEAYKKQRQAWITALRAGQNPFTQELLESLR